MGVLHCESPCSVEPRATQRAKLLSLNLERRSLGIKSGRGDDKTFLLLPSSSSTAQSDLTQRDGPDSRLLGCRDSATRDLLVQEFDQKAENAISLLRIRFGGTRLKIN